jgi:hypothetical protein
MSKVLKVLSSKMDQTESDLIQKVFIKGRGIEIFSEFQPILRPVRELKGFRAPPCFLLPISKPIGIAPMKFFAPLSKAGKGPYLLNAQQYLHFSGI